MQKPRVRSREERGDGDSGTEFREPPQRKPKGEKKLNPHCTSGRYNCYCHSGRARAVLQIDAEGNTLAEYCSAKEAARALGGSDCSVSHVIGGFATDFKGMLFKYKHEGDIFKRVAKAVLLVDPGTGNTVQEYESCREASRILGVSNSSIGACCAGKIPDVEGYVFRFKDDSLLAARAMELTMLTDDKVDDESYEPSEQEIMAAKGENIELGVTECLLDDEQGCTRIGVVYGAEILRPGKKVGQEDDGTDVEGPGESVLFHIRYSKSGRGGVGHKKYVKIEALRPMIASVATLPLPVHSPPPWPRNGAARYRFEEEDRIVRVDVSGLDVVPPEDEAYIALLMDRPDLTLVIKGLAEVIAAWPPLAFGHLIAMRT